MTIKEAEKKYGIELVDRTHLSEDDIVYWLNTDCEVEHNSNGDITFYDYRGEWIGRIDHI